MEVGRIEFEVICPVLPPWTPPSWGEKGTIKKRVFIKGASVVQVEVTSIDLERQEFVWEGYNEKRILSSEPGGITAYVRLRGETAQATGSAHLTEDERARLLELTTAIEERLMREFGG